MPVAFNREKNYIVEQRKHHSSWLFTMNRDNGGPAYFWDMQRTSAQFRYNSWFIGITTCALWVVALLLIALPAYKVRFQTTMFVTISVFILSSMLYSFSMQEWQVGSVTIDTIYKVTDSHPRLMELGINIGLSSVNITLASTRDKPRKKRLKSHPSPADFQPLERELQSKAKILKSSTMSTANLQNHKEEGTYGNGEIANNSGRDPGFPIASDADGIRTNSSTLLRLILQTVDNQNAVPIGLNHHFQKDLAHEQEVVPDIKYLSADNQENEETNGDGDLDEDLDFLDLLAALEASDPEPRKPETAVINNQEFFWGEESEAIRDDSEDISLNEEVILSEEFILQEEYYKAQRRGLPAAILTVLDYLRYNNHPYIWSLTFRKGGYLARFSLFTGIVWWCLAIILFLTIPKMVPRALMLLGIQLLLTNTIYASSQADTPLVIYLDGAVLELRYGWCFYLLLVTGILATGLGIAGIAITNVYPDILSSDFEIDAEWKHIMVKERKKIKVHGRALEVSILAAGDDSTMMCQDETAETDVDEKDVTTEDLFSDSGVENTQTVTVDITDFEDERAEPGQNEADQTHSEDRISQKSTGCYCPRKKDDRCTHCCQMPDLSTSSISDSSILVCFGKAPQEPEDAPLFAVGDQVTSPISGQCYVNAAYNPDISDQGNNEEPYVSFTDDPKVEGSSSNDDKKQIAKRGKKSG